jgi:glutamate 5-kinase
VAVSIKADLLILLSDIDGLYTADPRHHSDARLIPEVFEITPEMKSGAEGGGTALSTGGMTTKLIAAEICMEDGTETIILNGSKPALLYDVLEGKPIGTRFVGRNKK